MKRKVALTVLISVLIINTIGACTTFVIKDSFNLVYGRNFDWDLGSGFIAINKRGLEKHSLSQSEVSPAQWIAKYGSITFNQIGVDSPMEGMNETGLVIAQMALFESKHPDKNDLESVNELEWIQYQLDNSSSLAEVIENNKKIQIICAAVPVHYLICDSSGNTGVMEFANGELIIKQGKEMTIPVCSNMFYEESVSELKDYTIYGDQTTIPEKCENVSDMIAIASSIIDDFKPSNDAVGYGFEVLKAVGSSTRTQWSVVYDLNHKSVKFRTVNNSSVRTINLADFDFSSSADILTAEIHEYKDQTPMKEQFNNLTYEKYYKYKRELLDDYNEMIPGFPYIPDEVIKEEADYIFFQR